MMDSESLATVEAPNQALSGEDRFASPSLADARNLAWIAVRCLLAALIASAGIGLLAFVKGAQPLPGNKLLVTDDVAPRAMDVARGCLPVFSAVGLLCEFSLWLLLLAKVPWRTCRAVIPLAWGLFSGLIFFSVEEGITPHEIMLVSGGALVGIFSGILYLTLWRSGMARVGAMLPVVGGPVWPNLWYAMILILGAAFLGGFQGWIGGKPALQEILNYRAEHWADPNRSPLPPPRPIDDPPYR
ncbi:MAG: hypothetical protein U1D30_22735 [Planctomycetota bacterium]